MLHIGRITFGNNDKSVPFQEVKSVIWIVTKFEEMMVAEERIFHSLEKAKEYQCLNEFFNGLVMKKTIKKYYEFKERYNVPMYVSR